MFVLSVVPPVNAKWIPSLSTEMRREKRKVFPASYPHEDPPGGQSGASDQTEVFHAVSLPHSIELIAMAVVVVVLLFDCRKSQIIIYGSLAKGIKMMDKA